MHPWPNYRSAVRQASRTVSLHRVALRLAAQLTIEAPPSVRSLTGAARSRVTAPPGAFSPLALAHRRMGAPAAEGRDAAGEQRRAAHRAPREIGRAECRGR